MDLPLKGIIPPMVTPLNSYCELDVPGLERLIDHLVSGGVHGIFILGTNGEAPSLSYELRKELIERTCEQVNNRIPVLVGITDTSFSGSIDLAHYAKEAGADAVVVAPPYYFPLGDAEVADYYEALAPELPLPFLIYNMPSHTKIHLSADVVKRIKKQGAVGIKDSSGDMLYLYSLMEAFRDSPEFAIIAGTEIFLPEVVMNGGHGAIAGGANLLPELFVSLYNASIAKDLETIARLHRKVMVLYETIYSVGRHSSRFVKGTKCGLSVMGICNDYMAPPLQRFGAYERREIEKQIEQINSIK